METYDTKNKEKELVTTTTLQQRHLRQGLDSAELVGQLRAAHAKGCFDSMSGIGWEKNMFTMLFHFNLGPQAIDGRAVLQVCSCFNDI